MVGEALVRLDELADQELWLVLGAEHQQDAIVDRPRMLVIARRALLTNPQVAAAVGRVLAELVDDHSGRSPAPLEQTLEWALIRGRLSMVWRRRPRPQVTQAIVAQAAVPLVELIDRNGERSDHGAVPSDCETWFEARIVDGTGSPLVGVEVEMLHEGTSERLVSGSDGSVRLDGVTSHSATVWVRDTDSLRAALQAAWSRPTENPEDPMLEPSADVEIGYYRDDLVGPLVLGRESPKTLSIQPFVVLGRIGGMLFDTNKSFLLPGSLAEIAELRALYDRCTPCHLLVVGHTDTSGQADHNEALSLERARSVLEYLTDDVDAWLERYAESNSAGDRWGSPEDLSMIRALPDYGTREPARDPVRWFQATRGLEEDGIAGPNTRRALIGEYMARDGTSLPGNVTAEVHGCGEAFPLARSGASLDVAPVDGQHDPIDRRVELFFFGDRFGVQPPAPGSTSKAGTTAYPSWRNRAKETYERVIGPRALEIVLHDERGSPVPHARYRVYLPAGTVVDGELDSQGFARIERLPEGICRVDFPDLQQGFVAEAMTPLS